MAKSSGRNCVLIARVPSDWNPASIKSMPREILSTTLYARKLPLYKALAIVEAYNAARMAGAVEPGTWAFCVVAAGQGGVLNRMRHDSMSGAVAGKAGAR